MSASPYQWPPPSPEEVMRRRAVNVCEWRAEAISVYNEWEKQLRVHIAKLLSSTEHRDTDCVPLLFAFPPTLRDELRAAGWTVIDVLVYEDTTSLTNLEFSFSDCPSDFTTSVIRSAVVIIATTVYEKRLCDNAK